MTKTTNLLAISALTVAFAMLTTSALADAAILVKVDGIPRGDSQITGFLGEDGWFIADSFGFGVERELSTKVEKGGTEDINIGVGELQDVSISKGMDRASADLAQFAINGNSVGAAEICFVETGDPGPIGGSDQTPMCYLHYKLDRVFIKSWSISGDADDRPTEEVAFYYNKIAFAYAATPDGTNFERAGSMTWDNVKNVPWTDALTSIWDIMGLGDIID
jgi:type VI protein secretion system component Hcp